jgi:hypothetical protein
LNIRLPKINRGLSIRSVTEGLLGSALMGFVVFHLASMLLTPNWQNYLGERSASILTPYVNFFELTGNWSFFAPDIGPPPIFLEWKIFDSQHRMIEQDRWPPASRTLFWREQQNRRISAVRFMLAAEGRAEQMITPYLCKRNPKAYSVRLSRVLYRLPPFEIKKKERSKVEPSQADRSPFDLAPGDGFVRSLVSDDYCQARNS